jgi:hypothetical protein
MHPLRSLVAVALGALAMAAPASASISITSRVAQLQVTDQACVNSQAVCDQHLDPAIATDPGTGAFTFDHALTQPHVVASAGGDEAHADASGHYSASLTGGGDGDLVITTAGTLSASAGVTVDSGQHQNFAQGTASGQTQVRFTLDAPVAYRFAGSASVSGVGLIPAMLARDEAGLPRVFSMSQTGQVDGPATGTLAPGKYVYIDFGSAGALSSSGSQHAASASDTWNTRLTLAVGECPDIPVGHAVAHGCFKENTPGSGVFTTDQKAWVGGFQIEPRPGGTLVVDTHAPAVREEGTGVDMVFAGFKVPVPVSLLPIGVAAGTISLGQAGTLSKILLDLPVKGELNVAWASGGTSASLDAKIDVKSLTEAIGKLVALRPDENVNDVGGKFSAKLVNGQGAVLSSVEVKIDKIDVVPARLRVPRTLGLRNLLLRLESKNGKPLWTGQAGIALPLTRGELDVTGRVFAFDGSIAGSGLSVDGINKPIGGTPIVLQKVEGDLLFAPDISINLGVGATFGPRINGAALQTIDGAMKTGALASSCRSGDDPSQLSFESELNPLKSLTNAGLAKAKMSGASCIYVSDNPAIEVTASVAIDFLDNAVAYKGTQTGFVSTHGANLEGGVLLRLPALPELSGQAIISTRGIAACTNISGVFEGGFGYRWGDRAPSLFNNCDLSPFRVTATARAAAAGGSRSVRVPGGLPVVGFAAASPSGAPRVRVSGPGGVSVSSPAGGRALRSARAVVVPVAAEHRTYVFVKRPRAGSWRVQGLDGAALSSVALARGLPKPRVKVRVAGRGARRVLSYSVAPLPGQQVRFSERGAGVAHELGRARGRHGRIAFRTTVTGNRRRTIVAEVIQNGLPRDNLTVARFSAPARPKLVKPRLTAKRTKSTLTLSWKPVAGATSYLVEVKNGATVLQRLLTRKHKVTLTAMPATGALTVTARALGASVPPGPVAKAVYGRK